MPDNNNNNRGLGTGGLFSALSGGTPAYQRSSHTAMISTGDGRSTDNPAAMSTRGSGSRALPSTTRPGTSPRNTGNSRNNNNGSNSGMDIANAAMNANSNNKRSSLDTGMLKLSNNIVTATTKIETAIVKQTNMIERQTNAMISRLETISKSITSLYELIEKTNKAAIKAADEYNAKQPKFNLLLNAFKPQVLYEQQVEFFNRWLTSKVTSEQLTTAIVGSFFKKGGIVQRMFGYDMRIARENKQAMPWTKQDDTALTKTLPNALAEMDKTAKRNAEVVVKQMNTNYGDFKGVFDKYVKTTLAHYDATERLLKEISDNTMSESDRTTKNRGLRTIYGSMTESDRTQLNALIKSYNTSSGKDKRKFEEDTLKMIRSMFLEERQAEQSKFLEKTVKKASSRTTTDKFAKDRFIDMYFKKAEASGWKQNKQAVLNDINTLFDPKASKADRDTLAKIFNMSLQTMNKTIFNNEKESKIKKSDSDYSKISNIFKEMAFNKNFEKQQEERQKTLNGINDKAKDIANGKFSTNLEKMLEKNTGAVNTSSDVITKQTSALKAVSLGLQKFVAPKNLMSILTTGLKFWSLYKTIGMGLGGIRWLKDNSVVKTIGGFLQTWVWNPVKKYLVDPIISGFKSIVNEYVDPAVTKKLVDTLDTAGAAVKTVATAMFGGDDQRAEAQKRITSSIGSALKTHVVPYLVKIALAIWALSRARSAFGSAFSGIKTFLKPGEKDENGNIKPVTYKERFMRLKPINQIATGVSQIQKAASTGITPALKWLYPEAVSGAKWLGSGIFSGIKRVGSDVASTKFGRGVIEAGSEFWKGLKEGVGKDLQELYLDGKKIYFAGKQVINSGKRWFTDNFGLTSLKKQLSGSWGAIKQNTAEAFNDLISMFHKGGAGFWSKVSEMAKDSWRKIGEYGSSTFKFLGTGLSKFKGFLGRAGSALAPHLPTRAKSGGVLGVANKVVGGVTGAVGGIFSGAMKVASGALGAVSVVGPIVMILKELFTRFIAPKLSASGVSGDDSKGIGTALKDFTVEFMSGLFDKISGVVDSYGGFKGIVKSVFAGVGGILSGIWEGIKKALGVNSYGGAVMKIWSGVFDMFKSIFELAMDGFTSVARSIKRWIMTTLAKIPGIGLFIGDVEEEYRKEDIKEWRDNSIRDWIENDKDLKARYEEELKKNPNVSDTMAIMEGIIDAQTLKKIEAASMTDVIDRNSTYRAAVKQAENKLKNSNNNNNNEGSSVPAPPPISESSANTTTTNKPQPDKKTDSFRDKVTGALSSLRTYFSSGNFKKDLGTLADNFGKFLKDTFKEMRNFDAKSVGTTFADAFGSLAGNLAGGLMGDSEAFDMFNKLEKSATAKGFTTVSRFAQKAEYTLASDVEDIAKFTGGSEEKLAEVVRILNTGVKLGWDQGSSKNGSKSGTPAELSTLGADFGKGVASLSDSDIAFIKNANLDQIGAAAAIDVKSGVQNKPKGPVYASGLIIGSGFNTARMSSAFGDTEGRNHVHAGIDIATPGANTLAPILAPFDGTLVEAGVHTGYGRTVILRHEIDGQTYTTLYGHLDGHKFGEGLSIGAKIPAGSIIGYMGTSGTDEKGKLVDGAYDRHLHFGVAKGRSMPFKYESSGIMDPVDFLALTMAARASLAKGLPITEVQTALDNAAGGNGGGATNSNGNSKEAPKPNPTGTGEIMAAAEKTFTDSDISKILGTNRFSDFSKAEKTMLVNKIRTDPKYSAIVQKFHDDPLTGTYSRWVAGDDLLKLFNRDELKNEAKSYESDLDVLLGTGAEDIHMSTVFNTRRGGEFADLMSSDPEVQRLVAEYVQLDEERRKNGGTEEYRKKIIDAINKNNKLNDLSNQLGLLNAGQLHMAIQNNYANKKDDHSTIAASSSNAGGGSSGIDTAFIADMCAAMMTGNSSRNRMQYSYPYD